MKFQTKDVLSKEDLNFGLKSIVKDGYISQIMVVLTQGTFLIAFALKLGASNFIIGLLAAIPPLSHLIQIPAIHLIERFKIRRAICVYSLIFYRICILIMCFIPLLFSNQFGLIMLILLVLMQSIFASISNTAYSSWMHDIIPREILGIFYSKRMALSLIIAIITSLFAALLIEFWEILFTSENLFVFSILYFAGFVFGMLSIYFISKTPEPKFLALEKKMKFTKMISFPFKDKNYRNLILFLIIWSFAMNFAAPFFIVYLLRVLQLNIIIVVLLTIVSQIFNLLFLRIWGKLSDRFSNKSILKICCPLFLICAIAWPFVTLIQNFELRLLYLTIIHCFMGISLAGVVLASGNITLKLAPKGKSHYYLAITSVITSISLGLAPLIGGLFADYFEASQITWIVNITSPDAKASFLTLNIQGLDFYFMFSFLIGGIALIRLLMVYEPGDIKPRLLLHELKQEIRKSVKNLHLSVGLRHIVLAPISVLRYPSNLKDFNINVNNNNNNKK